MELPEPINTYFAANRRLDVDGMLAGFAPDATVRDEHRTHQGHAELRRWIETASVGNRAVATPTSAHQEGEECEVRARVDG